MPVYLYTYHSYRSWMPDNPRGYVRRGEGLQPPDEEMAAQYIRNAAHAEFKFDELMRRVIVRTARDLCEKRGWRLHQIHVIPSHVHVLVSWPDVQDWKRIRNTLKRHFGKDISKALDRPGPWFSRGASRKRVRDRQHFDYLMNVYLPRHHGTSWREASS